MANDRTSDTDTICAISTPAGSGGIAVIRISGPGAIPTVSRIWQGAALDAAPSHTAHLGNIMGTDGETLDRGLATVFRAPRTFTGEDVVELSVHGSPYIQQQLILSLTAAGCRTAEPGEFTRRAFVNGRLDLAEAEAVADIIAASSRTAHRLALRQLRGELSHRVDQLRESLVHIASMLELELDFSEEDVAFADRAQLRTLADAICSSVDKLAGTFATGDALRRGVPVAIIGRPNVGKSHLLNTLLDTDRAIVSDIPGTTRDTVEDTAEIGGTLFRFIDTAGLRQTDDPVESLGIRRTIDKTRSARIILWVIAADHIEEVDIMDAYNDITVHLQPESTLIAVINKADLVPGREAEITARLTTLTGCSHIVVISAKTGAGTDNLRRTIASAALPDSENEDENIIIANARHYSALTEAAASLRRVIDGLDHGQYTDLIAQDLREALHHLSAITGAITTDTLLQTIFSKFCVGK